MEKKTILWHNCYRAPFTKAFVCHIFEITKTLLMNLLKPNLINLKKKMSAFSTFLRHLGFALKAKVIKTDELEIFLQKCLRFLCLQLLKLTFFLIPKLLK
jgi:hypothetical protein